MNGVYEICFGNCVKVLVPENLYERTLGYIWNRRKWLMTVHNSFRNFSVRWMETANEDDYNVITESSYMKKVSYGKKNMGIMPVQTDDFYTAEMSDDVIYREFSKQGYIVTDIKTICPVIDSLVNVAIYIPTNTLYADTGTVINLCNQLLAADERMKPFVNQVIGSLKGITDDECNQLIETMRKVVAAYKGNSDNGQDQSANQ